MAIKTPQTIPAQVADDVTTVYLTAVLFTQLELRNAFGQLQEEVVSLIMLEVDHKNASADFELGYH